MCISGGWPGWRTFRQAGWSADERFLTIIGNGTNATASRTIARIDTLGGIDSSTRFSAAGVSPRSVVTTAGTDLWWSGDTGSGSTEGIRFTSLGSSSSGVALAQGLGGSGSNASGQFPVPYNSRVIGIFDGQLYGITAMTSGSDANSLVALSDTLGGTTLPSFSTLATAGSTYVFRGVALAPVPEPSSVVLVLAGAGALVAAGRRLKIRRG